MASIINIKRSFSAIASAIAIAAASHAALAADEALTLSDGALSLSDFGVFSSGGTVTAPVEGKYNVQKNWQDMTRAGTTAHVDHASGLYAIPAKSNGIPVVMLHGYGQSRTGFITTPDGRQGCTVAVNTSMEDAAALVLIEPGRAPAADSEQFKALLKARIPVIFYYGDYIANGPRDIDSTKFWQESLASARAFAKALNEQGGDAQVVSLPDEGIRGNSHFMFEERNSDQVADSLISRLNAKGL